MKNILLNKLVETFPLYRKKIEKRKSEIRREMRELRSSLSEDQKKTAADLIFSKIESSPEFQKATSILIYWSTKNEVPTHDFVREWSMSKIILLPSVKGHKMILKRYVPGINMEQGNLGIMEIEGSVVEYSGDIDMAIVPALAFGYDFNRLGRGKGFYDRYLKNNNITKIGIGYDFQLFKSIPAYSSDIKMNKIVTPFYEVQ